jgi:hypothetical protein
MSGQLTSNKTDYIENLPFPTPYSFLQNLNKNVVMLYTSAKFYRTAFNSNLLLNMPIGNNFTPTQYFSQDTFIPANTFNSTKPLTEVSYPNRNSVLINYTGKYYHDVEIDYKLSKNSAGDGYQNMRKIQVLMVRDDGISAYEDMISYKQPGPNNRDFLRVAGEIDQTAGDIVQLRFNLVQNRNFNDQSDSYLEIYSITWNISCLKVING